MNKNINMQKLQNKLKERLTILLSRTDSNKGDHQLNKMANPDRNDLALISTQTNQTWLQLARDQRKIREIDQALQRMENSTYGVCFSCEKLINPARLESKPEARFCIECKQEKA